MRPELVVMVHNSSRSSTEHCGESSVGCNDTFLSDEEVLQGSTADRPLSITCKVVNHMQSCKSHAKLSITCIIDNHMNSCQEFDHNTDILHINCQDLDANADNMPMLLAT